MKKILLALVLSLPAFAFAESSIECEVESGSEQGLALAPKKFEVADSDSLSLYADGTLRLSIEIGESRNVYYANEDIVIKVGAKKVLVSEPAGVQGTEKFSVKACDANDKTTATYSFTYRKEGNTRSAGTATYKCECALD
jgi:hypothetical protein